MIDLLSAIDAVAKLQAKLSSGDLDEAARIRAQQTLTHLAKNVSPEDILKLMSVHHGMVSHLRRILKDWHTNQIIIQQSLQQAREFGDTAEEDRLSGRLAGIVLLYEQVQAALNTRNRVINPRKSYAQTHV